MDRCPYADGYLPPRAETRGGLPCGPVATQHLEVELERVQDAFNRNVTRDLRNNQQQAAGSEPMPLARTSREAQAGIRARALASVERNLEGYKRRYLDRFGTQLNADNASELFEEYAATFERRALLGPAVRRAAAAVVDALFDDLIKATIPTSKLALVVFTAGGNGAGKTSSLAASGETQACIQFDNTLSSWDPSLTNIERALSADFHVFVSYVWRDPMEALIRGTLPRAMRIGRTVPLSAHSRTHPGARQTVLALMQRYVHDPRVTIAVFENPDGRGSPRLVRRDESWLRDCSADRPEVLVDRLRPAVVAERAHGRMSAAVHDGTVGSIA